MSSGGTYRVNETEFDSPPTTDWDEQLIAAGGLNGIPINNSYRIHRWNVEEMMGCDFEALATLYALQQANNAPLDILETDPYSAAGANMKYGTVEYTDFTIVSIAPRKRGLPVYRNVVIVFEVYVA